MKQKAIDKALSLVGQGYIYGAKGQICSPAFREGQAAQYPEQAQTILTEGAKWDGRPVWDCAQLTREAAKAAGVTLVSGATSQWNKTAWAHKGGIASLPEGPAFVFREKNGVMQHTGLSLGDGTCVHARGTAYGVVRQAVGEYSWTHWAVPSWPEASLAVVTALSGSTVNARSAPSGKVLRRIPIGTQVEVLGTADGWSRIRDAEGEAYMLSSFLRPEDGLLRRIEAIEKRLDAAGL